MSISKAAVLVAVAALVAPAGGAAAGSGPYHGSIRIDYRYTSGGNITPGSAPDVEQTAHITLTVKGNRITHLHGVVGFDYKQYYELLPQLRRRDDRRRNCRCKAGPRWLVRIPRLELEAEGPLRHTRTSRFHRQR